MCAVLDDSTLKCWGENPFGVLGQGDTTTRGDTAATSGDNLPPIPLGTMRTARAVAGMPTPTHACAVLDDGTVKCWGYNGFGQLGLGDTTGIAATRPRRWATTCPHCTSGVRE